MKKTATILTRSEMQTRVRIIREELETRHKTGIVKMAAVDGTPIPTETLQNEMFSLIYKLSKFE